LQHGIGEELLQLQDLPVLMSEAISLDISPVGMGGVGSISLVPLEGDTNSTDGTLEDAQFQVVPPALQLSEIPHDVLPPAHQAAIALQQFDLVVPVFSLWATCPRGEIAVSEVAPPKKKGSF
jgi:hypothetical protein